MMQKSKNLEKRMKEDIADKELLLKNWEEVPGLEMSVLESHQKRLLTVENLAGFEELLFNLCLLEHGQVIALTGENGRGKSSLEKVPHRRFGRYVGSFKVGPLLNLFLK